jgi:hypothetical protein
MESNESSWKLYLIFMALCFLMAIVVYLFYPVSCIPASSPSTTSSFPILIKFQLLTFSSLRNLPAKA